MKNSYIQSDLKVSNRRTVYNTLFREKKISRAELSHTLGISGATILKIIDYFAAKGICFYEEAGVSYKSVGRKPTMLRFNPNFAHIAAVFVEGEYISIAIVNMDGEICAIQEHRVLDVWNFLFSSLTPIIHKLLASIDRVNLYGIGIALPAVIDQSTNIIIEAPLLGNVEPTSLNRLVEQLKQEFSVPVCVQNDVNACAYGEYRNIYANCTQNLLYISVGTGVGCGIILDAKLVPGENNSAGEIGYMIFDGNGADRPAVGGWLEEHVNLAAVTRMSSSKECLALPPEERTQAIIDRLAFQLGLCIVNTTTLIDINTVVLGGVIVENYGEALLQAIQKNYSRLHYQKRTIALCKTYKPGVVGLSYLASAPMLEKLLSE